MGVNGAGQALSLPAGREQKQKPLFVPVDKGKQTHTECVNLGVCVSMVLWKI